MEVVFEPFRTKIGEPTNDIWWMALDEPDMMDRPCAIGNDQLKRYYGDDPQVAYKALAETYKGLPKSGKDLEELLGVSDLEGVEKATILSINLYKDDRCQELQLYLQDEPRYLRYNLLKLIVSVECEDFDQMDYTLTYLFYKNGQYDVHLNINRLYRNQMREVKGLARTMMATLARSINSGNLATISLYAAGDRETPKNIGYWYWPTLGFDAPLTETWVQIATSKAGVPCLYEATPYSVQSFIRQYGLEVWKQEGHGMRMAWDGILR